MAKSSGMRIALYQPDIAGNVGTIIRLAACFSTPLDIIMPCGFPMSDKQLRRAAMDYGRDMDITSHISAEAFFAEHEKTRSRIVLLTSRGETPLHEARFQPDDTLLLGSESAGVPENVHARIPQRVRIPMQAGFRSLNLAVATGIALHEAMRQTGTLPK